MSLCKSVAEREGRQPQDLSELLIQPRGARTLQLLIPLSDKRDGIYIPFSASASVFMLLCYTRKARKCEYSSTFLVIPDQKAIGKEHDSIRLV